MNFEMTGKLSIGKDTEKFHPYSENKYESGWVRKQLLFNATCGDNRHMLTVNAGADVYKRQHVCMQWIWHSYRTY